MLRVGLVLLYDDACQLGSKNGWIDVVFDVLMCVVNFWFVDQHLLLDLVEGPQTLYFVHNFPKMML